MNHIVLWYLPLKNPHVSGPVLFIPVMFKTHLYFKTEYSKSDIFFTFSVLVVVLVFCFFPQNTFGFFSWGASLLKSLFFFDSPITVKSTFILATSAHKRKLFYIVPDIYLTQGLSS